MTDELERVIRVDQTNLIKGVENPEEVKLRNFKGHDLMRLFEQAQLVIYRSPQGIY